ncbi:MAG: guanylate kinase [Candidatus Saccharimonadales bacterium]
MNQLEHAAEFRRALNNYKLSDPTRKILQEVKLALFVAPSASGRNTIIRKLLKSDQYYFIISDTTRQPRINNGVPEENGREYWFRSEAEMLEEIKQKEFLEAAVIHNQQVSGISVRELKKAGQDGRIAITDVEVIGAANIHRLKPDVVIMFMVPPSFDIWIERIHSRGQMPPDEVLRRMESAERELATALKSDYYRLLLNDTVEGTAAEVNRFLTTGYYDPFKERLVRDTAQKLYKDVEDYLQEHAHNPLA